MAKLRLFVTLLVFTTSLSSQSAIFDVNLFYNTKSLNNGSATDGSQTLIDVIAAFDVLKKPRMVVGWAYGMFSTSDNTGSVTTISTSDMGPVFGWYIDKDDRWSLFLTYNLLASASYSSGGSSADTWKGTSLKADVGWTLPIGESFFCGIKLNYYSATYNQKFAGGTTYSQVSYSRSFIYPSIIFSYRM